MRTLILALLVTPMFGAQAWVQNGPSTCNAVSGNITCTLAVAAGHTLHIGLAYRSSTPGVTSVVSSLGNTPVLISSAISPTSSGTWLYCEPIAASGSETITVTVTGTYFFGNVLLQEFSGSTCTVDGVGSAFNVNSQTGLTCSSFTPSTANTVVVGLIYNDMASAILTPGAGYATNAINLFSANGRNAAMEYKIVTAAVAQAPTFTASNGAGWGIACAALKASTAPTGAVRHRVSQ